MALTLEHLFASPDHYFHSFEGGEAVFVPMDRAAYARSIFLDRRISPAAGGAMRLPLHLLEQAPAPLPCNWIFHIAHGGSTLLARALDALGGRLVLREPLALRQLGAGGDPGWLGPTLGLLSRRYGGDAATLIKANVPVNFMLPDIAALQPEARAVFLYSSLSDYLLAILRNDQRRAWLRHVTGELTWALGASLPEPDAERGALLWYAQLKRFAAAMELWPQSRSLEAECFFTAPAKTLRAATTLFGQTKADTDIAALVEGPLFNTYSKNPAQAFDNDARLARRAVVATEVAEEIAHAKRWIAQHAPDADEVLAIIRGRGLFP